MIRKLTTLEKKWIDLLLIPDFPSKPILIHQLEHADVTDVEVTGSSCSLFLKTSSHKKYPYLERVPILMQSYRKNGTPIEFLLHVVDGFVEELEIYDAAGFELGYPNLPLDDISYDVRV